MWSFQGLDGVLDQSVALALSFGAVLRDHLRDALFPQLFLDVDNGVLLVGLDHDPFVSKCFDPSCDFLDDLEVNSPFLVD